MQGHQTATLHSCASEGKGHQLHVLSSHSFDPMMLRKVEALTGLGWARITSSVSHKPVTLPQRMLLVPVPLESQPQCMPGFTRGVRMCHSGHPVTSPRPRPSRLRQCTFICRGRIPACGSRNFLSKSTFPRVCFSIS